MTVLLWIIRAIIILIVLRFLLRLFFGPRPQPPKRRTAPGGPVERVGGELVRDPHCGTYIPKARAIAVGSGSDTRYFCSATCRDAFGVRSS